MEASDSQRMARARRAYEWGRVRFALRVTGYILPLVVVSLAACAVPERTIATGILLLLVAVGMRWRGGVYGRIDLVWACYQPIGPDDWNLRWARPNRFYESCLFQKPLVL